jgi:hypothetical protein
MSRALTSSLAFLEAAPKQRSKGGVDRRILMAQSFAALRMWRGAFAAADAGSTCVKGSTDQHHRQRGSGLPA